MTVYMVSDGVENNASPDCSSAGGGYWGSSREQAIAEAEKYAAERGLTRCPDRENDQRPFYAEKIEPWDPRRKPRCPTCGQPTTKHIQPRPPRLLPRSGPPPRYNRPYARREYVTVETRESFVIPPTQETP